MKPLITVLSVALVIIFILSGYNSYKAINSMHGLINISNTTTEAFDPALKQIHGFEETEKRMGYMISNYRNDEKSLKSWNVILNLIVTIATGLTALITSISTAKNNTVTKQASITIAIITFTASIISFTQSQLNSQKETAQKKTEDVKKIRDEMESLKPDELSNQLVLINRRLDEM